MTDWTQAYEDAINAWQSSGYVHPLTCGVDSRHDNLQPWNIGGQLMLLCPTCSYTQEKIPDFILSGMPPDPPFQYEPPK